MSTPDLEILVAHGVENDRRLLVEKLEDRHSVVADCATIAHFKAVVSETRPELIIAGLDFPDGDGLETLIELGRERPIPAVVVTAKRSLDLVLKAMEDHVMAYLLEPVSQDDLEAALVVAWTRYEQFRELHDEILNLEQALQDRKVIERAKGVLMSGKQLSEHEAFVEMRKRAQDTRRRIVEVAADILSSQTAV